jgi:hypothetical protein
MSLSIVLSEYGATDQRFHHDSEFSYYGFPSLIIPSGLLRLLCKSDRMRTMGATGLCAGNHGCSWLLVLKTSEAMAAYGNAILRDSLTKGSKSLSRLTGHHAM